MEHCIVYFSSAVEPFDENLLLTILQQSRHNNVQLGITGVILYVRGNIIQILEGKKEAVEALYQRIKQDHRHTNVSQVLNRPIHTRLFKEWSMGYETITTRQLAEIEAIVALNQSDEQATQASQHIILKTLKVFYNSNRYN